jgi:hypothetical protein
MWCVAPHALAQEEPIRIPFAPAIPSVFAVSVRTETSWDGGAQTSVEDARYTLELRARNDAYEAIWTANDAQTNGRTYGFNPALMIGLPISLALNSSGEPSGVQDWPTVRQELVERLVRDERSDLILDGPPPESQPRQAAISLAAPLAMIALCQGTDMRIGEIKHAEREYPPSHGFISTARTSRELRSIDREAGTARIVFVRLQETREEGETGNAASADVMTMRAECTVDLRSGVARNAVLEVTESGSLGDDFVRRSEVTVTPQ